MMSFGFLYWLLMIIWLALGLYDNRANLRPYIGGNLLLFVLLVLIGWRVFGAPFHVG